MKLKLCGIRRIEDVEMINSVLPDYIGFIFYRKSKRYVDPESARILEISLKKSISPVGVFVNETAENIAHIAEKVRLKAVQLHGDEDEEYISSLRRLYNGEIWKAVRVKCTDDVKRAEELSADMLLYDSFSSDAYGGTGKRANLSAIISAKPNKPFFLAGGIDAENIGEILARIKPYGIDLSGGIEVNGVKNRIRLMEFIDKISDERTK